MPVQQPSISAVTEQLKLGISLLNELHVLSQTQNLLLENRNLTELAAVVESKKALVDRITAAEDQLASLRAAAGSACSGVPELVMLKQQALLLIERISAVEQENQRRLEDLRAEVIQRSRTLRDSRKLHETYGSFLQFDRPRPD
jgi:C4-dicarboxylate-specific signal transduction histidine kinase